MSTNARCVALVGPYLSGKTSLMEAMLHAAGAVTRKGTVKEGNTVGDASPESRDRNMSTEILPARFNYLGDDWTVLDCPGSVEFLQEAMHGAVVADIAVVVCEPDPARAIMLAPILRFLDTRNIPHVIFINKVDTVTQGLAETMEALQGVSSKPLVVRHIPVVEGEVVSGYVDLISERAYSYNEDGPSELISVPEALGDDSELARQELMEELSNFDDSLLEALLEEATPARDEIYAYFKAALAEGHVVPVM
ncbi:MAG: GTP-binding protein, partial [Alphaproteobacteria bacterium]|nr:GTP-binding protein [Alphaproteobacteria bacterium]